MDHIADEPALVKKKIRKNLIFSLKVFYGLVVAAVLIWAISDAAKNSGPLHFFLSWKTQVTFVLCWAAMAGILGLAWTRALKSYVGVSLPAKRWLTIQGAAWAGRYLPGKIGLLAGKMSLVADGTLSLGQLGFSVLFEQVAFVLFGSAVVLALVPLLHFDLPFINENLVAALQSPLPFFLSIALTATLFFGFRLVAPRFGIRVLPEFGSKLTISSLYALAHALPGIGFFLILQGMSLAEPTPTILYSIALLAAANISGALAIFAPAGLGVREAVLAAGLAAWMPFTEALAIAAALRVLTVIADILFSIMATALPCWKYK